MNFPEHDYMSYKKESNLDYFCQINTKKLNQQHSNSVYATMKSYSMISKLCNFFGSHKQNKKKTRNYNKKLSILSNTQQTVVRKHNQNSFVSLMQPCKLRRALTIQRKPQNHKIKISDFKRTHTQINDITTRLGWFQKTFKVTKQQLGLMNRYDKILDKYYDKLPSPTSSITRQSIIENDKLQKFCEEDIYLQLNKQAQKNRHKRVQKYHQPQIPNHVKDFLKNNQRERRNVYSLRQQDKVEVRKRILSVNCHSYQGRKPRLGKDYIYKQLSLGKIENLKLNIRQIKSSQNMITLRKAKMMI